MNPSTADDRRGTRRAKLSDVFVNKYIDGIPHAMLLVDVSADGICVTRLLEPESDAESFAVELSIGGVRLWAWTRRVWRKGRQEALRFVAADPFDRARLRKVLRGTVAA